MPNDNGFPTMGDDVKGAGRILWYIALAVIIISVVSAAIWYFNVATSDIQGRGNQKIQINSADNRTFQYEHFLQLDGTIRSQAQTADASRTAVTRFEKQHPNASQDNFATTQLRGQIEQDATGAEQICRNNVAQYNNEAASVLRQKFVDNRLPVSFPSGVCTDVTLLPPSISGQR
jgi:preprotein translocase subunit SecF